MVDFFFGPGHNKVTDTTGLPYNDKLGDAKSLTEAVELARTRHGSLGGDANDLKDDNVAIVKNGENLWALWERHGKPQGISWEQFKNNNLHLKDPRNLSGNSQSNWRNWHLVHQGDVVFIPDKAKLNVKVGSSEGIIVEHEGDYKIKITENGATRYENIQVNQTFTYPEKYGDTIFTIKSIDGDKITVQGDTHAGHDGHSTVETFTIDLSSII